MASPGGSRRRLDRRERDSTHVEARPTSVERVTGPRLAPYVEPHLARRRAGETHPVHDFLFTYYSFSPAKLLDWQPGWPESGSAELLAKRRALVASTLELLRATAARTPRRSAASGCTSGRWCTGADETRHPVPLRLGAAGTDEVVESHRIACSHFDAFRFFTPSARAAQHAPARPRRPVGVRAAGLPARHHGPLQARLPALAAGRLRPRGRLLRARLGRARPSTCAPRRTTSPTSALEPIRIETPEGKQEYAARQRAFAERAAPLRERLITVCEQLQERPPDSPQTLRATWLRFVDGRPGAPELPDRGRPAAGRADEAMQALVVLDHLAQEFEPGRRYTEAEVNELITSASTLTTPLCGATWSTTGS